MSETQVSLGQHLTTWPASSRQSDDQTWWRHVGTVKSFDHLHPELANMAMSSAYSASFVIIERSLTEMRKTAEERSEPWSTPAVNVVQFDTKTFLPKVRRDLLKLGMFSSSVLNKSMWCQTFYESLRHIQQIRTGRLPFVERNSRWRLLNTTPLGILTTTGKRLNGL